MNAPDLHHNNYHRHTITYNMRINSGACRAHEEGSGTNTSAQEVDSEGQKKTLFPTAPPRERTQGLRIRIPTLFQFH